MAGFGFEIDDFPGANYRVKDFLPAMFGQSAFRKTQPQAVLPDSSGISSPCVHDATARGGSPETAESRDLGGTLVERVTRAQQEQGVSDAPARRADTFSGHDGESQRTERFQCARVESTPVAEHVVLRSMEVKRDAGEEVVQEVNVREVRDDPEGTVLYVCTGSGSSDVMMDEASYRNDDVQE
jgi:hypothetical protein